MDKSYDNKIKKLLSGSFLNNVNALSGNIHLMNSLSKSIFNSMRVFDNKLENYIKLSQIPTLYIPKVDFIVERFCNTQSQFKEVCESMDKMTSILAEHNYLLPLSLPISTYITLCEYLETFCKRDNREKEIGNLLLKLFSRNKWEMASDIVNKLYENEKINPKRIEILKNCIKVINRNSRKTVGNVVLPTIIAQIEGIWSDILGADSSVRNPRLKGIVDKNKDDLYIDSGYKLLKEVLFKYTKVTIPCETDFSRNKILHGEEVNYGSPFNLIRAFLIIEFLDFIKDEDSFENI